GKLWLRRNTELNGDGFRDVEHEEAAAPGTRRFVVIGDSIAFGVGVEDRSERVGEVLARSLAAQGKKVEAFSAALADTHTLDHIQFLKRTQRYEPELVILLYFFNDIDYMASVTDRIAVPRGYLAQRLHPKLFLFRNSYLFNELFVRVRGLAFRTGQKQTADLPPDPYLDDALLARHLDDLKSFVDLARQGGARAVVVPFDLRTVLGEPHLGRCLRLVAEATKRGIPVIDPSSAFKGHDFASITANPRDSHPNGKGHGLVAAYLAEHLGWPN
ncbi:MAG: SGNH/GDSL hydrolase family protein, partial [Planctomycetota bacterium]|nr:SGNH/GDSL hydrolase family protein [Planctomycetota bacterium]